MGGWVYMCVCVCACVFVCVCACLLPALRLARAGRDHVSDRGYGVCCCVKLWAGEWVGG